MHSIPQRHAIILLHLIEEPTTQEHLTSIAPKLGCSDTPQSLRSRMVELERAGYAHRVDRNGVSSHNRPCWRWQLTKKGRDLVQELLDPATPAERK